MERISVIVKPNARENTITKIDDIYKVTIKAVPKEGKANLELIKFLSKHFKRKARKIIIILTNFISQEKMANHIFIFFFIKNIYQAIIKNRQF